MLAYEGKREWLKEGERERERESVCEREKEERKEKTENLYVALGLQK